MLAWLLLRWKFIAAIALGMVILCGLSYCQGRSDGRAALEAEQAKATQDATSRADQDEQGRRDANQNRADDNEGVIRNAIERDPENGSRPVGNVTSDLLNSLRDRQRR